MLNGRRKSGGEEGMALVMVISIGAVLTIIIAAGVTYALGGFRKAATDESWNAAVAAAYAGVEEYQSRLANDTTYTKYGNPASTFSSSTGSAVTLPATVNPAFGLASTGTWASVPGSNDQAQFRYEVDNSKYSAAGTLRLRSTGKVGSETRTIVADLKQQGFVDFLYFTDFEISDPAVSGARAADCAKYAWNGRPANDTSSPAKSCSEIQFQASDVLAGPVHSNDTVRICGARFKGEFTTGYNPATGVRYQQVAGCGSPTFDLAASGFPKSTKILEIPAENSLLKRETRSDLTGAEVPLPGCLYTGPTSIVFNSDGTITVRSPWTVKTNTAGDTSATGSLAPKCGTPGTSGLGSSSGQTFLPPENNVLFVQSVPIVATDVNYWASNAQPSGLTCTGGAGSSGMGTVKVGSVDVPAGNGIGYPRADEAAPSATAYGCRNGDVFTKGTVNGNLTIGADNYIYVTGDLKYADANDDMVGLIGNNAIWVWNPMKSSGSSLLADTNRRIDAAILSVQHTFAVQNHALGGYRGVLTVKGAIAQKFRGPVGLSGNSAGYSKNYEYDLRLKYTAPPKFLSPVSTTYGVNTWIEVNAVFNPDGSSR